MLLQDSATISSFLILKPMTRRVFLVLSPLDDTPWCTSWRELLNTEQDLETLYQNDCTDSSDSDCRQIHAVIKQVTENDVENRNFQYLATSGYFVHDFEELNIEKNLR